MDENRAQAYLDLIQQLLTCPNGEKPQILQANSELLDGEFLQICEQVATMLAEQGQENRAGFWRNLASQLGEFLGVTSAEGNEGENNSLEDYQRFWFLLLQTELENFGGDPRHIYAVLQANLDKLNLNFIPVLEQGTASFLGSIDEPEQAEIFAALIENIANKINQFPRGSRANNLEIAIAAYEIVLSVRTRETNPEKWAQTQNILAIAYSERIRGERADHLEEAIACYHRALEVYTRDAFPEKWAQTQNILAIAYSKRIRGERADHLEEAIACSHRALEVYTRDAFPEQWAMTQNILATAYSDRIRGERADNLEQAIACSHRALEVRTREAFPEYWADTQNNLANAYLYRIRGERADNLELAIACYHRALEVRTRDAFPQDWADTQNNLATAYRNRIRGERADNLEQAIACYQSALEVYTRDAFPENWAMTQNNLATAYSDRIRGERADNLEQAIACSHRALEVRTREAFPEYWADTQNNLANAYLYRIRGERADNLELAIACYHRALEVRTRDAFPQDWADTQNNLATAYRNRIRGERADNLEQAIACYQSALEVYTREAFPEKWAMMQNNLAIAYYSRIRGERADHLELAIACSHRALEVRTREAFPEQWAMTQNNLANAYLYRIRGERADNLEQAIACYQSALEVYTRDAFPEYWAMMQNNLANAYLYRIRGERADHLEEAIACYHRTLEVHTRDAFPQDWAMTQNNLANAYLYRISGERADNLEEAIEAYQAALTIRTRSAFPQENTETLSNLGILYRKNQQWQLAYDTYTPAIETVEFLRGEIHSGDETKQKLAEEWNKLYLGMVEVCIALKRYTEAVEFAERSKGQNLIELLSVKDLYPQGEIPPEVRQELQQLRQRIAEENRRLQQAPEKNYDTINQLRQDFAAKSPYIPLNFAQIQQLADDKTAIVEWYILDDSFCAFIITEDPPQPPFLRGEEENSASPLLTEKPENSELLLNGEQEKSKPPFLRGAGGIKPSIPNQEPPTSLLTEAGGIKLWQSSPQDLEKLIAWVNEYLESYGKYRSEVSNEWQDSLREKLANLAQILHIDEIIQAIPKTCDKLILIPHRYLHLFPLHALPISQESWQRFHSNHQNPPLNPALIDCFDNGLRYTPSCQLLHKVQQQPERHFDNLFAIQTPTTDLYDKDYGVVNAIKQQFSYPVVIKKQQANKSAFLKQNQSGQTDTNPQLQTTNCLFFYCHGFFDPKSPLNSGLQLADGNLTLEDIIAHFDLKNCRLVTMSACETGFTDFNNNSDEYIGLPSGFMLAGSHNIIGSLWTVSALATSLLMTKFYEQLPQSNNIALALNQSQKWLRDVTIKELKAWLPQSQLEDVWQIKLTAIFKEWERESTLGADSQPLNSPAYWAGFCAIGKGV